jgi:hypothetical protein
MTDALRPPAATILAILPVLLDVVEAAIPALD